MRLIHVVAFLWVTLFGVNPRPVSGVCPPGCTCDDENLHVNCVDANLDIVPITLNPSVQRLILGRNRIKSIDAGTLTFYHELLHVDLSHNHLVRIQPGSFASQTKLIQLHLNSNKISHLSNRTFGGPQSVMNNLAVLYLQGNLLDSIDPGVFIYTPNVEEIDLTGNPIKELSPAAFLGLTNLRTLKLEKNELTKVPDVFSSRTFIPGTNSNGNKNNNNGGGFGGSSSSSSNNNNNHVGPASYNSMVPHLAELSLAENTKIETIGNDAFSAAKNLNSLDLRGCQIKTIEPHAFRGLEALRKLYLTDNSLTTIPTTSFPHLVQLDTLKIGRNPFDRLSKYAFGGLKKLKNLEIEGAQELSFVESEAFANNLDLETVEVSTCKKLAILPSQLFKGLSGLKHLKLKDNALQDLPEDLVSWRSLRTLKIDGNPFRCVCDLFWLRDLLLEDKFKNTSSYVMCTEPSELRGKALVSLSSQDLNCYLQGPIQKTILGVSIACTIVVLVVVFFLLYRYHERIKNTCKRGFRRSPRNKRRSSVISSYGKELDTATKTSFLSQCPYPDDDFQVRASLMSSGSPAPGAGGNGYMHHGTSHTLNPVTMSTLNYPYSSINSFSVHHPNHHYKSMPNNYSVGGNYPSGNEYDAPINSINYPHIHNNHNSREQSHHQQIDHNLPIHYPLHHHQPNVVKPIPITEL